MMRFTFIFNSPDGEIAVTGTCHEETGEAAFHAIEAEAERLAYGPVTVVRTCFSVIPWGAAA